MAITTDMVKELRQSTGAGVLECRKALEACEGDMDKALQRLREKGLAAAEKRAGRAANQGVIGSYIHTGSRVASLIEVNCETDFVALTDEFQEMAHDLAMQVVAARARWVNPEDVPADVVEAEKAIYRKQVEAEGKPTNIVERIVTGKLEKFYDQFCLLRQPHFRNPDVTVGDYVKEQTAKMGENVIVRRFVRYEVGETD